MTTEYVGRRMRCNECSERVVPPDAYRHYLDCGGTLRWPYRPDRMDSEATTLEDYE